MSYQQFLSDLLNELNGDISVFHHIVTTSPRTSPMCINCIQDLAGALKERYHLSRQLDDLEQSILHYTEAIFLPPHWDRHWSNIAQNLFSVVQLLILWAARTQQPEDVKRSAIYLRYLRGQSPEAFNMSSHRVTHNLVYVLTLQVLWELGDMMQDIGEMAVLFLEDLNSDTCQWTIPTDLITFFSRAVKDHFGRWGTGKEPLATIIDCLWQAKNRLPDLDELSITLTWTLLYRFDVAHLNDDYEEGTAILDKFLTSHTPEEDPNQYLEASILIAAFTKFRLIGSQTPEHLEEAIYHHRNLLSCMPLEDPNRPHLVGWLKFLQHQRFKYFGVGDF